MFNSIGNRIIFPAPPSSYDKTSFRSNLHYIPWVLGRPGEPSPDDVDVSAKTGANTGASTTNANKSNRPISSSSSSATSGSTSATSASTSATSASEGNIIKGDQTVDQTVDQTDQTVDLHTLIPAEFRDYWLENPDHPAVRV